MRVRTTVLERLMKRVVWQFGWMLVWALFFAAPGAARAAEPIAIEAVSLDRSVDFQMDVLPILRKSCLSCHHAPEPKGELLLETVAGMLKGGEDGPVIVPGDPSKSALLLSASRRAKPTMPPPGNKVDAPPLSGRDLGVLQLWIEQGAKGPAHRTIDQPRWQRPPANWNPIYALSMSGDAQFAAVGRGGRIHVYQVPTGRIIADLIDPKLAPTAAGHPDAVGALALSPDGTLLASGGFRAIKLWRSTLRERMTKLQFPAGHQPLLAAISPDGKRIATASDSVIMLWDTATGAMAAEIKDHTGTVAALRFSGDGTRLASGGTDHLLLVHRVADGSLIGRIETTSEVRSLAWLGGDARLAVGDPAHKAISLWPIPTGAAAVEPARIGNIPSPVAAMQFIPAGAGGFPESLLAACEDGTVRRVQLDGGQLLKQYSVGGAVSSVAMGGERVMGITGAALKLFQADTAQIIAELRTDAAARRAAREATALTEFGQQELGYFNDQARQANESIKKEEEEVKAAGEAMGPVEKEAQEKAEALAKAGADCDAAERKLKGCEADVDHRREALDQANEAQPVDEAAKRSAAQELAAAQGRAKEMAKGRDEAKGRLDQAHQASEMAQRNLENSQKRVEHAATSLAQSQKRAAEAKTAAQQAEADFKSRQRQREAAERAIGPAAMALRCVAAAPDGMTLICGSEEGRLLAFTADKGRAAGSWAAHGGAVLACRYTPEGDVASVGADGSVRVASLTPTWKLERVIEPSDGAAGGIAPPVDRVLALAFSPDGQMLASGGGVPSREGELCFWRVSDGGLLRQVPEAHSDTIFDLSFAPVSSNAAGGETAGPLRLASGAADKTVKVFDASTGGVLNRFEGHASHVLSVSWNRNGRTLISGGGDGTVKVWNLTTGVQVRSIDGLKRQVLSLRHRGFGGQFAVGLGEGGVRLMNEGGGTDREFETQGDDIDRVALSDDGQWLASGGRSGVLRIWDVESRKLVAQFAPPPAAGSADAAAPGGPRK